MNIYIVIHGNCSWIQLYEVGSFFDTFYHFEFGLNFFKHLAWQGCQVWGGGPYPIQGLSPTMKTCPPHGDIGPPPRSEIFGALRALLVISILNFKLEANVGYIVIL